MYRNLGIGPLSLSEYQLGNQIELRMRRGDFDLLTGLALVDTVAVADEVRGALDRAFRVWTEPSLNKHQALRSSYEPLVLKRREATTPVLFRMAAAHELSMDNLSLRPGYTDRDALICGAIRGYLGERLNAPNFEAQIHTALAHLQKAV